MNCGGDESRSDILRDRRAVTPVSNIPTLTDLVPVLVIRRLQLNQVVASFASPKQEVFRNVQTKQEEKFSGLVRGPGVLCSAERARLTAG